jgi:hypothetical protein
MTGIRKEQKPMYEEGRDGDLARQQAKIQDRLAADAWRFDPGMEQLAKIKVERPDVWDSRVSGVQKMAFAMYESGKASAARHGLRTDGPR